MAQIPTYERQVGLRPIPAVRPDVRMSPRDAVGQIPEAIDAVGQVYAKAREDAENAQVLDAFAQLGRARQDIETTVKRTEGRAALEVDLPGQASGQLGQVADDIASKLPSDRARAMFRKIAQDQVLGVRSAAQDHQLQQDRVYRDQSFQGALSTAVDLGVQGAAAAPPGQAADSHEVAAARENALGAVNLRFKDAPEKQLQDAQTAALTKLHAGAVQRLLDDQRPADAERYLTRWRGEMDPVTVGTLERGLREASQSAQAEAKASEIIRNASIPGYAWKDPVKATADVEAMKEDDPLKPRVRELVGHQLNVSQQLKGKAANDWLNRAQVAMNQGVSPDSAALSSFRAFANDAQNDAGDLVLKAKTYWDSLQRARDGQPATPAQQGAMVDFLVGLRENVPRYLAQPELFKREWMDKLHPKDLERAATYVGQAGLAAGKPDETLPPLVIQQITTEGQRAGVFPRAPPAKWNPDQKERFRVVVEDLLGEQQKARGQGKQLDDATVKGRLGYWFAQGDVEGGGVLGTNRGATRVQAATSEDLSQKPFRLRVQGKDRAEYEAALPQIDAEIKKSGMVPNDDWRRWFFLRAKGVPDAENPKPEVVRPPPMPAQEAAPGEAGLYGYGSGVW